MSEQNEEDEFIVLPRAPLTKKITDMLIAAFGAGVLFGMFIALLVLSTGGQGISLELLNLFTKHDIGVNAINVSEAYEAYAAQLKKSADELTMEEKTMACLNAVLEMGDRV